MDPDFVDISNLNTIADITNVFYINLTERADRKAQVEQQLSNVGLTNFNRFNAIKLPNGALGCSMSHLKCLQLAKDRNLDHILIVEDDIIFLNPGIFIGQLNKFLQNNKEWDILLIAGNNVPPYRVVDDTCVQVSWCQTTTGYLIRKQYYDTLINNIKEGINKLIREPKNKIMYAIDKYWLTLQKRDTWLLLVPLTVSQREGYSNIENCVTNFTKIMVDLDKPYLINNKHN
jgi:GR25 family glycosyltransferase involved in LPS biosynthesis